MTNTTPTTEYFFNPYPLREMFPALHQDVNGAPVLFLDGPGGTQVPLGVIKAMNDYWVQGSSNLGGRLQTGTRSSEQVEVRVELLE